MHQLVVAERVEAWHRTESDAPMLWLYATQLSRLEHASKSLLETSGGHLEPEKLRKTFDGTRGTAKTKKCIGRRMISTCSWRGHDCVHRLSHQRLFR